MAPPEKEGEIVLSATGALLAAPREGGDWGGDAERVARDAWFVLGEVKHLLAPSETLKRLTVSFEGRDYVITGKDGQYHVVKWRRPA
eukprot:CAMPEP_0171228364 /NCGR_PEP_ID=MMETSP0790-20130122/38327_1 /TAXON_ID=2925 /ORGANISM="Alexandrium catenella, Strain OF101" /LENGTH=86 /DNA_ID=CAMNT_0011694511 /DNA_START=45 /DNA_END=305 /DNA_ORIENTATION=+